MTGLRRFRLFAFQFFWYNLRRKEVFAMTDIEALKESVSEKLYAQEPLAQAILSYLNNSDPAAHQAILNRFDEIKKPSKTKQILKNAGSDLSLEYMEWSSCFRVHPNEPRCTLRNYCFPKIEMYKIIIPILHSINSDSSASYSLP